MTDRPDADTVAEPTRGGARTVVGRVDVDSLTPRAVKRMLTGAESGDLAAQAELFARMEEKDGELDAHLRTRKAGAARLAFEIEPADGSGPARRAAELCRRMVEGVEDLSQALFDLLDAVPKGFSCLEIDWLTSGDRWTPRRLMWRPQRWFTLDEDGETLLLRGEGPGEERELNPLNWLVHRVKARSGFSARTGLLRSCVRAFVVRHFAWKDWMAFAEVYGMPPRIGWLREEVPWDSKEARELFQAVRALGMDAAAVVREGNRIEALEAGSQGEGRVFERIIARAGREMTLAVLGQTLTSGGEEGGSYALGRVHDRVRWDLVEADAAALARTLTRQLLRPIVRLNLGEDHPAPRWRFDTEKPEDLQRLAETVGTLSGAGLPIPAAWAYRKFGIPQPKDGQRVFVNGKEESDGN
ncbi:MAG: phage portal protein family protein [Planctomycetota bacterium]